jgi:hypothetical protein
LATSKQHLRAVIYSISEHILYIIIIVRIISGIIIVIAIYVVIIFIITAGVAAAAHVLSNKMINASFVGTIYSICEL